MKIFLIGAIAMLGATTAHAAVIPGLSAVTDNGGGSYTFVFDTVTSDIDGTGMGLSFSGFGLSIIASSDQGRVRQDFPAHGGLGVLGPSGTDNLELGLGETLKLVFSQTVEVVNWTFNGLGSSDGHTDAADGRFLAESLGSNISTDASLFDGVGSDVVPGSASSVCAINDRFCATDTVLFRASGSTETRFKGYLESVTIKVAAVPVPASLGLMLAGIAGLGAVARKRRRL